jgi:hypothetical protein
MDTPREQREKLRLELAENTASTSANASRIELRVHVGPLQPDVGFNLNQTTADGLRVLAREYGWRPERGGPRSDSGFGVVLGEQRNLWAYRSGSLHYRRLFPDPPNGSSAIPFPEFFIDVYRLVLMAERAYPALAGYTGEVFVGMSVVNAFDRPVELPTDREDFFAGEPVRTTVERVDRWLGDGTSFASVLMTRSSSLAGSWASSCGALATRTSTGRVIPRVTHNGSSRNWKCPGSVDRSRRPRMPQHDSRLRRPPLTAEAARPGHEGMGSPRDATGCVHRGHGGRSREDAVSRRDGDAGGLRHWRRGPREWSRGA